MPMRIGVVGAAGIAERALIEPARSVDEVVVAGVAARDPERAAAYAKEHGIAEVYPTYQALVEDDSLDAVYVPLANSLHARWAIAALDAGRHVLCEKPLASNAAQAAEVVAAAERNDRVMVEAFHWRYHPVAERMLELARAIGPLHELEAQFRVSIPANNVRYDYDLAGGSLMDLGCYCVHMVRTIVGTEPQVESATAVEGPPGVDVSMEATLAFPGDITALVGSSMVDESAGDRWMFVRARGSRGELDVVNPMAAQLGHVIRARLVDGGTVEETIETATSYEHQLRAFCRIVAGEQEALTGGADSIANMAVVDAVYQASGLGIRH